MNGTRACDNGRLNAPVIDTLLAATAIEHSLYLVSRNTRDVRETGAAVFNPWYGDPILDLGRPTGY